MIRRDVPPAEVVSHAQGLQQDFDELWVVEDLPWAGGISQLSAVLEATNGVVVGHGIAPAPFRNAAALAMEWATLAELHPGRVSCGVGHGVQSWMGEIGARVASPLTLLSETIDAARRLLAGDEVSTAGRYVNLEAVKLVFPPAVVPPVSAGVVGPRSLRVSGAVADGTILPEGHGPDDIRSALRHIGVGSAEGAHGRPHRLTVFVAYHLGNEATMAPRNPAAIVGWEVVTEDHEEAAAELASLFDAGAHSVVLVPLGIDPAAQLAEAARQVVPLLRAS